MVSGEGNVYWGVEGMAERPYKWGSKPSGSDGEVACCPLNKAPGGGKAP